MTAGPAAGCGRCPPSISAACGEVARKDHATPAARDSSAHALDTVPSEAPEQLLRAMTDEQRADRAANGECSETHAGAPGVEIARVEVSAAEGRQASQRPARRR